MGKVWSRSGLVSFFPLLNLIFCFILCLHLMRLQPSPAIVKLIRGSVAAVGRMVSVGYYHLLLYFTLNSARFGSQNRRVFLY